MEKQLARLLSKQSPGTNAREWVPVLVGVLVCGIFGSSSSGIFSVYFGFPPLLHRLLGLVVKASASRAEGPGFESRLRRDFFGVESYQ